MPWTTSPSVMKIRRRSYPVDLVVEMLDGWRRHLSGRNASLIAFFGFLSIFPLALAATTILGWVLEDNVDLQRRIADGAFDSVPLIGKDLAADPTSLNGNVVALVVGLLGALWSLTKAFAGIHSAQDDVWEVSVDERDAMPKVRARALLGIVVLGGSQIGSMVLASIVTAADLPAFGDIGIIAATLFMNVLATIVIMKMLTSAELTWGDVVLGGVIAGVIVTALQHFGTWLTTYFTENASSTYGDFAVVLGLVTWMSLMAIGSLMCVELNAARSRLDHDDTRLGANFDLPVRATTA